MSSKNDWFNSLTTDEKRQYLEQLQLESESIENQINQVKYQIEQLGGDPNAIRLSGRWVWIIAIVVLVGGGSLWWFNSSSEPSQNNQPSPSLVQ